MRSGRLFADVIDFLLGACVGGVAGAILGYALACIVDRAT